MNISKSLLLAVAATTALSADAVLPQTGTGETNGYKLVWQDLFDSGSLRNDRWNIEIDGGGGGNNELQFYSTANVSVGDDGDGNGCLILTARRQTYNGRSFTSGRINSKKKVSFKHAKVEAAIKLPTTANGLWPAFWMMGNDYDEVGWPKCGETDICEFGNVNGISRGTQDRYFNGACHWGTYWNDHRSYARDCTYGSSLQDGQYHIFTCIWDADRIAMYVDLDKNPNASPYYEMTIPETSTDQTHPGYYFHKENFIIFNLAVGGDFPSIWSADGITALNDANNNEARMYVNYVKVYQKGGSDESLTTLAAGDTENSSVAQLAADASIEFDGQTITTEEDANICIFNLAGSIVANEYTRSLDASSLSAGIYIVKAKTVTGKQATLKIAVK